jgi:hypothetical protein
MMPCKDLDLDVLTMHDHADRAHLLLAILGVVVELLDKVLAP